MEGLPSSHENRHKTALLLFPFFFKYASTGSAVSEATTNELYEHGVNA